MKYIVLLLALLVSQQALASYDNFSVRLTSITDDTTFSVPPGMYIRQICLKNTTANAIAAGIKFGTTSGATDVVVALAAPASLIQCIPTATVLLNFFSTSAAQTIFVQDVAGGWNSSSWSITISLGIF